MAWTAPITWADDAVYDAADFNEQIRDNFALLKTPLSDVGRVLAISSAYFSSLDGTNLTGVALVGAGNTYTAGVQNFSGGATARVILPVGADKYDGTPGNKTAGSLWIEGDYLHWVADTQSEWRYLGLEVATPAGATVGAFWVEGSDARYVDASGVERRCLGTVVEDHVGATPGVVWMEAYLHWIRQTAGGREYRGFANIAAQDVPHVDIPAHDDAHVDTPHNDVPLYDDAHYDQPHADVPEAPPAPHIDIPHVDEPYVDTPHTDDAHVDTPHTDTPYDDQPYTDTPYTDQPTEIGA